MQRVAMLRQDPDLAAAASATTPFGTPRQDQATGSPMAFPTADQPGHRQSAREQQRFMQQQHQSAMAQMRLLGVDIAD
eukprot:8734190-Pyramimonas_sp.AAC.1